MTNPDVKVRILSWPMPHEAQYVIRAIVQAQKECARCGYSWMFYGSSKLTTEELEDHGFKRMSVHEVETSDHPFIVAKRDEARESALKFFNRPMNVCKMCHPEGSRMRTAREEDNDKD